MLPGATPAFKPSSSSATSSSSGPIESTFDTIRGVINEDVVKSTQGIYQFDLSGNLRRGLHPYKDNLWGVSFMLKY